MQNPTVSPTNRAIVSFARDMAESLELHLIRYFATAAAMAESTPHEHADDLVSLFAVLTEKLAGDINSRCVSLFADHVKNKATLASYIPGSKIF